jgi:hypothetical protein
MRPMVLLTCRHEPTTRIAEMSAIASLAPVSTYQRVHVTKKSCRSEQLLKASKGSNVVNSYPHRSCESSALLRCIQLLEIGIL